MANLETNVDEAKSEKMSSKTATTAQPASGNDPCIGTGETNSIPSLIPTYVDACKLVNAPYSCLVVETNRRHVALSPMYLNKKRTGIHEELNTELLKYSESMKGVPLAYDDVKILGQYGDIYDDQGFIHMNVEASFVIFRPKRGQKLLGIINKVGASHVGGLVHGCFNASIPKPHRVTLETWREASFKIGDSLQFEVSQLDADAVGVLLIRGRLERERILELEAAVESTMKGTGDGLVEPAADSTPSEKAKKKKKRDKVLGQEPSDSRVLGESGDAVTHKSDGTGELSGNTPLSAKKKKKRDKVLGQEPSDSLVLGESGDAVTHNSDGTGELNGNTPLSAKKKKKRDKILGQEPSDSLVLGESGDAVTHNSDGTGELSGNTPLSAKKKKKRDKILGQEPSDSLVLGESGDAVTHNSDGTGELNGKKKKQQRRSEQEDVEEPTQASPVGLHASDSSGYLSDRGQKNRKRRLEEGTDLPDSEIHKAKKKRKNK